VHLLQISDPIVEQLPSFFQLTPHKDQFTTVDVQPYEICTFVRNKGIIVRPEFKMSLLDGRQSLLHISFGKNMQKITTFMLPLNTNEFLINGISH
jgi:hypothetical protein